MGIFEPPNMIITFANIIFFIVVQTLFFKYVASKQFNNVLDDKVGILNEYLKYNTGFRTSVEEYLNSEQAKELQNAAKEQNKKREDANTDLMKTWIGIPLVIAVVILLFFIYLLFKQSSDSQNKWSSIDTAILSLVVGAYSTEIMFYLGIVRQYEFYGDQQIYSRLYDGVHNSVNREPVTKEGAALNKDIKKVMNAEMKMSEFMEKHKDMSTDIMKYGLTAKSKLMNNFADIMDNPKLKESLNSETGQKSQSLLGKVAKEAEEVLKKVNSDNTIKY